MGGILRLIARTRFLFPPPVGAVRRGHIPTLAWRFVFDHSSLKTDEAFWERMKSSFSDQQILELLSLIGFCLGVGRLLAVLDVANDCPVNLTADPGEDPSFFAHG